MTPTRFRHFRYSKNCKQFPETPNSIHPLPRHPEYPKIFFPTEHMMNSLSSRFEARLRRVHTHLQGFLPLRNSTPDKRLLDLLLAAALLGFFLSRVFPLSVRARLLLLPLLHFMVHLPVKEDDPLYFRVFLYRKIGSSPKRLPTLWRFPTSSCNLSFRPYPASGS